MFGRSRRVLDRRAAQREDVGGGRVGAAEEVHAAVVRHPVQPGPQVHGALVGAQRAVGADEHVLENVLGVLPRASAQHLAHVREQPLAVAIVDRVERLVAAGPEQSQQLLIGAKAQQRRAKRQARQAGRCMQC